MNKKTNDVVTVFRELAKYPQPTSAFFSNQSTASTLIVKTNWSQRDLELSEKTTFSKTYVLSPDGNSGLRVVTTTTPQEISNVLWDKESPTGKFRAIFLKSKNKKGDDKQYLEIWNSRRKIKTFDVQKPERHGKVYDADGKFGCVEWSPTERYLVYVAEKKIPKAVSFFKEETKPDGDHSQKELVQGDEHLYREDWGEVLVDKHHPVPCIIDIESGEITVLDAIPNHLSAGQACWAGDDEGVVFVGWSHAPYRLGASGYMQRKTGVYFVDVNNTKCALLSSEDRAVCSPRFSPDKSRLLYMDIAASGVHHQCMRLVMYDWCKKTTSVVVDTVHAANGDVFPGLYNGDGLPERCWLSGGEKIIVDTLWRSRGVPVVVNLEKKNVLRLDTGPHKATSMIADVWNDYVILLASAPDQRNHLMVGKLNASGTKWLALEEEETKVMGVTYKVLQHEIPRDRMNAKYSNLDYESVLCLPTSPDLPPGYKPPLIVCPHGGPHTTFDVQYDLLTAGFCQCGFAVLLVNYRGSLGFGQNSIDSLPGNIGDQDVKDVWAAAVSVIESGEVDSKNIFVFGESHGGFLTTHLIGQYPGKFKAASCRNPVIDLTTMLGGTDCPDWAFAEMCKMFEYDCVVDHDMLVELWKRSPLSYVHQVTTPLLLMIGKDDGRVPTKQARQYYRILKARKQEVRFLAYDDNSHLITSVPAESDCFVNIMKWFTDHME